MVITVFHFVFKHCLCIYFRGRDSWGSQGRVCLAQVRPGVLRPVGTRRHRNHVPRAVRQGRLRDSVPSAHHAAQHQACELPFIAASTFDLNPYHFVGFVIDTRVANSLAYSVIGAKRSTAEQPRRNCTMLKHCIVYAQIAMLLKSVNGIHGLSENIQEFHNLVMCFLAVAHIHNYLHACLQVDNDQPQHTDCIQTQHRACIACR